MSMTDAEAGLWLNFRRREACDRLLAGDVTAENDIAGYDHALQAIADRATLVVALDAEFETVADVYKRTYVAISVAHQHMEGR